MTAPHGVVTFLVQPPDPERLARSAVMMWVLLAAGGVVFVAAMWSILSLARKRAGRGRLRRRAIKDAWAESARRLEVQPPESPEEDDLRVDR